MLTQIELDVVEKYVRYSASYACHPFDYDPATKTLSVTKSKIKYVLAILHFAYTLIYTGFLILRLYPGYGYTPNITTNFSHVAVFHFFYLIVSVFHVGSQTGAFLHQEETVLFYNQLIAFNAKSGMQYFGSPALKTDDKAVLRREKLFLLFEKWMFASGILIGAAFVAMPNNPHYIWSIMPPEWKNIFTFFPFWVCETFYAVTAIVFYNYASYLLSLYTISTTFWLRKACEEWLTNPPSNDPTTHYNNVVDIYRCLTIINTLFNLSLGSFALPVFKTACETCSIVCIYGMIKMFGRVDFNVYIFLPALGIGVFSEHALVVTFMATIHDVSSGFKRHNKIYQASRLSLIQIEKNRGNGNNKDPDPDAAGPSTSSSAGKNLHEELLMKSLKIEKKRIASCRALRCKFGSVYFLEKSTKIDLAGMMLDSILGLLISTK